LQQTIRIPVISKQFCTYLESIFFYLLLMAGSLIMVAPFLFMVSSSLKTDAEILAFPPTLIPREFDFQNYPDIWMKGNFSRYFANTLYISVGRTALVLATTTLAAYAFAVLRFPGRNLLFVLFLSTMMLPGQVTLIPVYVIIKKFPLMGGNDLFGVGGTGLINTFPGIIIPGLVSVSSIFLLRQFMTTIPRDMIDAARIDGGGEFRIFSEIVLPMTGPALATVGIFTFQGAWNDFLWPLLVGQRKSLWTLQVALAQLRSSLASGVIQWSEILAGTVIATLPIMIVFLLAQRYFVRGIALTGIK